MSSVACSSAVSSSTRKKEPERAASFACLECGKTFPSQQAMAGHCSAHTRAGAKRRPTPVAATREPVLLLPASPAAAAPSSSSRQLARCRRNVDAGHRARTQTPPPVQQLHAAARYVPYYARPIISVVPGMMVTLPPYLHLFGRSTASPSPATMCRAPVQTAVPQLGWATIVPVLLPPPWPASDINGGAAPSAMSSSAPASPPEHRLGYGSGGGEQEKRTLVMDGGDDQESEMEGLDLELRL